MGYHDLKRQFSHDSSGNSRLSTLIHFFIDFLPASLHLFSFGEKFEHALAAHVYLMVTITTVLILQKQNFEVRILHPNAKFEVRIK